MKETSPGRARNRSFLAPTSGGNSFLKQIMCFFLHSIYAKKWSIAIYCQWAAEEYFHLATRWRGILGLIGTLAIFSRWEAQVDELKKNKFLKSKFVTTDFRSRQIDINIQIWKLKNEPYFVVFAVHQLVRSIKPEMGHERLLVKKYPKLKVTFEYSLIFDI